jgi:sporulation protein YlmC with PRC-barrel domain
MLRHIKELEGYAIRATDGMIGHVKDFYFDDKTWVVRYLVVEPGSWLSGRKVLISPIAIGQPNWADKILPVSITREQVKNSPDIDTDKPVSRQHEMQYLGYYGYPWYWGGAGLWGSSAYPGAMLTGVGYGKSGAEYLVAQAAHARTGADGARDQNGDPHLRSCKAVISYHIHASDGDIGHVQGMLVEEETWAIRYIIVNTSNWWLGHQLLIAPQWIQNVSWSDERVTVDLPRQAVRDAPPYDSSVPLDRNQELRIYKHYRRASYWQSEAKQGTPELRQ